MSSAGPERASLHRRRKPGQDGRANGRWSGGRRSFCGRESREIEPRMSEGRRGRGRSLLREMHDRTDDSVGRGTRPASLRSRTLGALSPLSRGGIFTAASELRDLSQQRKRSPIERSFRTRSRMEHAKPTAAKTALASDESRLKNLTKQRLLHLYIRSRKKLIDRLIVQHFRQIGRIPPFPCRRMRRVISRGSHKFDVACPSLPYVLQFFMPQGSAGQKEFQLRKRKSDQITREQHFPVRLDKFPPQTKQQFSATSSPVPSPKVQPIFSHDSYHAVSLLDFCKMRWNRIPSCQ